MSNLWVRGPICGIDNCRSRLYRSLDGRKICQYGHVREDDIEINDEEDDNFILTRRLRIPTSQVGTQASQKQDEGIQFGLKGRLLYFECCQFILQRQCELVLREIGSDEAVLKDLVRQRWVELIEKTQKKKDDSFNYDLIPKVKDTISLVYLGCHSLRLPVYISDFYRWIVLNKIPYMNAHKILPTHHRKRLPTFYLNLLFTSSLPHQGGLYLEIQKMNRIFQIGVELNYSNFFFKELQNLILPLDIFQIADKLVSLLEIDLRIENGLKLHRSPELKLLALLIPAIKIFFFDQDDDLLVKWLKISQLKPEDKIDPFINMNDIIDWSGDKIDDYLHMISNFVLDDKEEEVDIAKKRVDDIFIPQPRNRMEGVQLYDYYKDGSLDAKKLSIPGDIDEFLASLIAKDIGVTSSQLLDIHGRIMSKIRYQ